MNCKFVNSETEAPAGKRAVVCPRCNRQTFFVPLETQNYYVRRKCIVPGWGDYMAHFLVVVFGIDRARFTRWTALLRPRGKPCGCQGRQEAVNEAGWRFERAWQWLRRLPFGQKLILHPAAPAAVNSLNDPDFRRQKTAVDNAGLGTVANEKDSSG